MRSSPIQGFRIGLERGEGISSRWSGVYVIPLRLRTRGISRAISIIIMCQPTTPFPAIKLSSSPSRRRTQPSPLDPRPPQGRIRQLPERGGTDVEVGGRAAGAAVHDGEIDGSVEAGGAEFAAAEGVGVGVGGGGAVEEEVGY